PEPVVLEAISASPATVSLTAGQNQALSVTATYTNGDEAGVTSSAEYVTSNGAVATVDASGVVQAVSAGSATITIT
ncbi:Ig-like domain-containing protein, partial [Paenibacillus sinopodophylli]|uniref:Ig-like domain-containing protein n=1 Tax=Paenibacillus sinopodophylli TaxID=1837342 RepID=UPI001486B58A